MKSADTPSSFSCATEALSIPEPSRQLLHTPDFLVLNYQHHEKSDYETIPRSFRLYDTAPGVLGPAREFGFVKQQWSSAGK